MPVFLDPETVEVQNDGEALFKLKAAKILIACGTRPAHNAEIPFDNHPRCGYRPPFLLWEACPKEIIVVGAGVVGPGVRIVHGRLGCRGYVDRRAASHSGVRGIVKIVEALSYHLRQLGITFRLGEKGNAMSRSILCAIVLLRDLESGKKVQADALIFAVGRQANG